MKDVFLIMAHHDLEQLNALIHYLKHPNTLVFVHLDKKSNIRNSDPDKYVIPIHKRICVNWGGVSQVVAIIESFKQIQKEAGSIKHIHLLSGEDFPVKNVQTIMEEAKQGLSYMDFTPFTDDGWERHDKYTYFHYYGNNILKRKWYAAINKILMFVKYKRDFYGKMMPYGGSVWFTLSGEAFNYIMEFLHNNPDYIRFFNRAGCCDEYFFHSILLNSNLKNKIVRNNFRYIDWVRRSTEDTPSPYFLTEQDYEKIMASGKWFCRKVNSKYGKGLRDKLILHLES